MVSRVVAGLLASVVVWTAGEAAVRAQELPDAGQYQVGVSGKDRDGNPTQMRSFVAAVWSGVHENWDSQALAEALAWQADDLLMSMPMFPHAMGFEFIARAVALRDATWGVLVLSREQGLQAARQLGEDAVLAVAANDNHEAGASATIELIDMADGTVVGNGEVKGASPVEVLAGFPAGLQTLFESVGLELSPADRELLAKPAYTAEEYAWAGKIMSLVPSEEQYNQTRAFAKAFPQSGLAQSIYHRTFKEDFAPEEQLAWLKGWLKEFGPGRPFVVASAAEQLAAFGAAEEAEAAGQQYEAARPGSLEADRLLSALAYRGAGDADQVAMDTRLVEACPLNAAYWWYLGNDHWERGAAARGGHYLNKITPEALQVFDAEMPVARDALERAAELGPQHASILADLIKLRRENGERELCEKALDECDAVRPGYVPAYKQMEWLYKPGYANDEEARRALLRRLSGKVPLGVSDQIDIAGYLADVAPFTYWKPAYERAFAIAPAYYPTGLRRMGEEILKAQPWVNDPDEIETEAFITDFALKAINKSLEQWRTFPTERALGKALKRALRFEEAARVLGPLVAERPKDAEARLLLGEAQRALGQYAPAAENFRAALDLVDRTDWDQTVRAYCGALQCLAIGDPAAARALLGEKPVEWTWFGEFDARRGEQLSHLAARDFEGVSRFLEEAPKDDDTNYYLWLPVALAKMGQGDWAGAVQDLGEAQKIADTRELRRALMVCQHKLGQEEAARANWDALMKGNSLCLRRSVLLEEYWPLEAIEAFDEMEAALWKPPAGTAPAP